MSELSKPVAWRYRYTKPGITDSHGEAWVGDWKFVTDEVNCNPAPNYQKCALYSQEYVSALQTRIAELEAKLATPVRLSRRYETAGYCIAEHYCQEAADGDYLDRDELIASLREQGFTVEGGE